MNLRLLLLIRTLAIVAIAPLAASCLYKPLYGTGGFAPESNAYALSQVYVAEVDTRIAQQVRNHLVFLIDGGKGAAGQAYELRLRVTGANSAFAAVRNFRDATAGAVTVSVSYDLIDTQSNTRIAGGTRVANASYDRTSQSFANERAILDAENRAAREAAEQLRLALAADLSRPG